MTFFAAAASPLAVTAASAQNALTVKCVDPATRAAVACEATIPLGTTPQMKSIGVRVSDRDNNAVSGGRVRFYATSGRLAPDSSTTDAAGVAATTWYRDPGAAPAVISIDVRSASGGGGFEQFKLTVAEPTVQYGLSMNEETDQQNGFEKAPLARAIEVQLRRFETAQTRRGSPVTDPDKCPNYRVAFASFGKGSVSPDTAVMWYDDDEKHEGCFAYANWTLPEGAGRRDAKATLVGSGVKPSSSTVEFEAFARGLPRIIGGVVATHYAAYMGVRKGTLANAKVERVLPDNAKLTRDTTIPISNDTVQQVAADWRAAAVIGISAPVVPRWHHLSLTAGIDMNSPTRDWYFGASLARAIVGLLSEAVPVDAHLLVHVGRSDVVRDQIACGTQLRDCRTQLQTRFQGLAVMISVNASTLVADALKKLGI